MLVKENFEVEFLRLYGSNRTGVFFSGGNYKFPFLFSAEFLRPFSSKRTKFERGNSAEH